MLRARRYRVLFIFAAAFVLTFFHFARSRDWSSPAVEESISIHPADPYPKQPPTPNSDVAVPIESTQKVTEPYRGSTPPSTEKITSPVGPSSGSKEGSNRLKDASDRPPSAIAHTDSDHKDPPKIPTVVESTAKPPHASDEEIDNGGGGRIPVDRQKTSSPSARWSKFPERYPVPAAEVIKLPKQQSKAIPKLQAKFKDESSSNKQERLQRLSAIKSEFKHAWQGYKQVAMGHDEVKPLSKESEDPFNGWGATLVDSLDTLWIMEMKDEFSEAVDAIKKIDFKTSLREDIPVFETTIRYIGGLLGAYDISGHRYSVLLEKAEELAEILIGAFDTPNRMPHLYYRWAPEFVAKRHRASSRAGLAELGSLSLEFTRLAQLTRQDKYYDAIARVTNELEKFQDSTSVPGLWPIRVNAQGCTRYKSQRNGSPADEERPASTPKPSTTRTRKAYAAPTDVESYMNLINRDQSPVSEQTAQRANGTSSSDESYIQARKQTVLADQCNGGLELPLSAASNKYSLGGMADSTYEYLPKEYLLLGGANEQYQNMYTKAATAARKNLLFQPMVKGGRDIRFMASTTPITPGKPAQLTPADFEYEGHHLTCFVGGMYALGAKAFGIEGDMELAAKLTEGCVWAYESTQTGLMPERFRLLPCEKGSACEWDQARFDAGVARYSRVDPEAGPQFRNGEDTYGQRLKLNAHEAPQESENRMVPVPMPGSLNPHDTDVISKRDGFAVGKRAEPSSSAASAAATPVGYGLENRDAPHSSSAPASPQVAAVGKDHLPAGMISIPQPNYYLRPEAIESVFIMYRLTGDETWRRKGWQMFEAIARYTRTELAHAAINDVTAQKPSHKDTMESFWLSETLKYFYLLFSDPSVVDLDKYVLNTEAHPFLRPV
ncbi:Glycoside hydrolase family 47 [Penicillium brevicompactum]|uniref:alpha-1,2-Mannosidase n=1 Tax=Penicillium brevicompactum TaxID=5074 RepID=A0A9W9RP76_PENBR|nr:Glycoside hydrolase family 47 [Penicillium brevicompactum]